jgi:heptose-I-phosphate ethanolaminephosphotransferase
MKPFKFILLWLLPIFTALLFELLFADFYAYRWYNVLENTLFATAMLLTVPFFNSGKIKAFLVNFYFLIFVFCLFFESVFFYLFNTFFTASAVFILIETNLSEASEFLGFYLDVPILVFFLVMAVLVFIHFKTPKKDLFKICSTSVKWISFCCFLGILALLKFSGLIVQNFPYLVTKSTSEYISEQQKMSAMDIDNPIGNFKKVVHHSPDEKSLYVLVLGESTSRNHLGIYDYPRKTTPQLNEIKDELLVYQNVISPHTYTIETLKQTLTLNGFKNNEESSIVQLMNQAGFKTFWFSNQQPIGPFDSMVTEMAQAADVLEFSNSNRHSQNTPFDGVLLDYFEKALDDPADKKFIVLHLLGTHLDYENRYPEDFAFFTGKPPGKFTDELASETINHYDNAVRYLDWILKECIEKTRKEQVSSYVLYLSDHGEEVYQSRYFSGHTLSKATKNMFEIPFILWRSEEFKMNNPIFEGNLEMPFVTDDFLQSLADLSQIGFEGMKKEKSIFSENFQPKKRIVGEGIDFDKKFGIND